MVRTLPLLALALCGCHWQGSGNALLRHPSASAPGGMQTVGPVTFSWQARGDATTGDIQATLPDGRRFTGHFVEPTSTAWNDYSPGYMGVWSTPYGWGRPWYNGPRSSFSVFYSGKALAQLIGPDQTRMRCEFTLFDANAGMSGGGQGDCQISTNEDVFGAVLVRDP